MSFSIMKNDTTKVLLCGVNLWLINETSFFLLYTFNCFILFVNNQICMHLLSHDLSFYLDLLSEHIVEHVKFFFVLHVFVFWTTCCNFGFNLHTFFLNYFVVIFHLFLIMAPLKPLVGFKFTILFCSH